MNIDETKVTALGHITIPEVNATDFQQSGSEDGPGLPQQSKATHTEIIAPKINPVLQLEIFPLQVNVDVIEEMPARQIGKPEDLDVSDDNNGDNNGCKELQQLKVFDLHHPRYGKISSDCEATSIN